MRRSRAARCRRRWSKCNLQAQSYESLKAGTPISSNQRAKFDVLNAHIANSVVFPGELVIVGEPSTPSSCTSHEAFLMGKAAGIHLDIELNVTAPLTQHSNRLANPGCCAPDFLLAPIRHDATSMQNSKISSPNRRLLKIHRRPTCSGQVGHQSRGI